MASAGVHGQLTSSISAVPRAHRLARRPPPRRRSVWWSFTPRNPAATAAAARPGHVGGPVEPREARIRGDPRLGEPAQQLVHGHRAAAPTRSHRRCSTPLDREHAETRGGRRGACCRWSRSTSRSRSVGGSPTRRAAPTPADDGADAVGAPQRERPRPSPRRPSSVVTRTRTCFRSRAVQRDGGSVGFRESRGRTASTVAIFTRRVRGPGGRPLPRSARRRAAAGTRARASAPWRRRSRISVSSRSVGDGPGGAGGRLLPPHAVRRLDHEEDHERDDEEVHDRLNELPDAQHDGGFVAHRRLEDPADLGEVHAAERQADRAA